MGFLERLGLSKKKDVWPERILHNHKVSLSEAFDLIESELDQAPDKRIRAPFETAIKEGSITVDALKRWGSQSIELAAAHDEDGTLVLSTGSPKSTSYDFPDRYEWGDGTREHKEMVQTIYKAQRRAHGRSNSILQAYSAHNHPPQTNPDGGAKMEIPTISFSDAMNSAINKTDCDIILSPSTITLYKNRNENLVDMHAYESWTFEEQDDFMMSKGVLIARITFADLRTTAVLDFLNGKATWSETHPMLRN